MLAAGALERVGQQTFELQQLLGPDRMSTVPLAFEPVVAETETVVKGRPLAKHIHTVRFC